MHSFLIIHKTQEVAQKKVEEICTRYTIHPIDQTKITSEKRIGIEEVRELQKNLSLFPLKSKNKAAIMYNADTLTLDAQNAFLKTLEEPPAHTIIILLANSSEGFLPTILSRCTLLQEREPEKEISPKQIETYDAFFQSLPHLPLGERLQHAQAIGKNKETAITSLEAWILFARKQMLQTNEKNWVDYIRNLQKTYTLLSSTNANPRLAIEHMLLSL